MTKNRVFFKVFFIASVIGLATGLIFFNVKKAKADTETIIYEMNIDTINTEWGMMYADQYNGYWGIENLSFGYGPYNFMYNGLYYKIFKICDSNNYPYTKTMLQNCKTFFFTTPSFYDGFDEIEDDNGDAYSIDYTGNYTLCNISFFSSPYSTTSQANDLYNDVKQLIDLDYLIYYGVTGGDFEGQTVTYYHTESTGLYELFNIDSAYNDIYMVIQAGNGYLSMVDYIGDELFPTNGITYNYPSIYFSTIQPMTIVNGRTEEEYRQYGSYMYEEGYNYGQQRGYDIGYNDGQQDGYEYGYEQGYDIGYDTGYDTGIIGGDPAIYEQGYNAGVKSNSTNMGTTIAAFFQAIGNVLSIKIFGNTITLGTLIFVPVVLGLLWAILKIIRG